MRLLWISVLVVAASSAALHASASEGERAVFAISGACDDNPAATTAWEGRVEAYEDLISGTISNGQLVFGIEGTIVGGLVNVSVSVGKTKLLEFSGAGDGTSNVVGTYRSVLGYAGPATLCWRLYGPNGLIWTAQETSMRWAELSKIGDRSVPQQLGTAVE